MPRTMVKARTKKTMIMMQAAPPSSQERLVDGSASAAAATQTQAPIVPKSHDIATDPLNPIAHLPRRKSRFFPIVLTNRDDQSMAPVPGVVLRGDGHKEEAILNTALLDREVHKSEGHGA